MASTPVRAPNRIGGSGCEREQARQNCPPTRAGMLASFVWIDRTVGITLRYWEHMLATFGSMPKDSSTTPGVERNLARMMGRLHARAQRSPATVSEDAHRLLRRIQAESAPLMVVFQKEQEATQVSLDFARRHGVDAPRHLPRAQKRMGQGGSHCGSSPFPVVRERGPRLLPGQRGDLPLPLRGPSTARACNAPRERTPRGAAGLSQRLRAWGDSGGR